MLVSLPKTSEFMLYGYLMAIQFKDYSIWDPEWQDENIIFCYFIFIIFIF